MGSYAAEGKFLQKKSPDKAKRRIIGGFLYHFLLLLEKRHRKIACNGVLTMG